MKRISKMEKLPCIKNKCIVYPSCVSRDNIKCEELSLYYQYYMSIRLEYTSKTIWFKIGKTLPNLKTIRACKIGNVWHMELSKPNYTHKLDNLYYPGAKCAK